jgi:beta-lactamase regulating signal transducer with metallopeptidase domain
MASLMSYCVLIALLMSLLGVAAERFLATRNMPRRAVWAIALTASLAYPALRILPPPQLPRSSALNPAAITTESIKNSEVVAPPVAREILTPPPSQTRRAAFVQPRRLVVWPDLANWNRTLQWLWIASTISVLAFYLFAWLRLRLMSRRWTEERVNDASMRIADDLGPAVVGLFKPRIVLPRWLLHAPADQRRMALDHEHQHIAAKDPLLLYVALLLIALAPWNLPLWWQLRRLRFSIEVDCDRRVLNGGTSAKAYGEMLLVVGQRQRGTLSGVLALTEKSSQLERRIRVITGAVGLYSRSMLIALFGFAATLAVAATVTEAPNWGLLSLLKHPLRGNLSPLAQRGRATARAQFPELFDSKIDGFAVVAVVFNNDGSLFTAAKMQIPQEALPGTLKDWASGIPEGAEQDDVVNAYCVDDVPIDAWSGSKNPYRIVLVAKVLRWPIDPTRSAARVKQAVQDYFPDLLQAPDYSNNVVTVFMNDDGTIKRGEKRVFPPGSSLSESSYPSYAELGVAPEAIGRSSEIMGWQPTASGKQKINLRYAWPRRVSDRPEAPSPGWWWSKPPGPDTHETPGDRAIVARHFPGVLENGVRDGMGLWVLIARDGTVLKTGQSFRGNPRLRDPRPNSHGFVRENTTMFVDRELEARYPGIKVGGCDQGEGYKQVSVGDQTIPLDYACLLIQSPITDIRQIDTSKRADVFIGGRALDYLLIGDTKHALPIALSAKFGEVATGTSFISIQAIATDASTAAVDLKVRLASTWWTSEWPEWSAPIRVAYDEETTVEVPNNESGTTHLVLRPIRLSAAE